MYTVKPSSRFKKDLKIIAKRGYDIGLVTELVKLLDAGSPLPERHKDHALTGNWVNYRECHITPDWLLVYKLEQEILILTLTRTGTHSDLF